MNIGSIILHKSKYCRQTTVSFYWNWQNLAISCKNIVAAFHKMHISPAKHSYVWLPRKCDYRTDAQTHGQTPDKVIPKCRFASQATQKWFLCIVVDFFFALMFKDFTSCLWRESRTVGQTSSVRNIYVPLHIRLKFRRMLSWIGCLTSQLAIFQSYMWRHIDVQADWRSWIYGWTPNSIDIS